MPKTSIPSLQEHVLDAIVDRARDAGFAASDSRSASNIGTLFFHEIKAGARGTTGVPAIAATLTLSYNFQQATAELKLRTADKKVRQVKSWYVNLMTQTDELAGAVDTIAAELAARVTKQPSLLSQGV